jgi:hypothetical protein
VPESVEVMVPVEGVVAVEPIVPESSTWVIAPGAVPAEAVTAPSSCLGGRVNRKHDRQCGDGHKCHVCRTSQLVHGDTSLSPPTPWDVIASREIHVAATRLTAMAALQRRAMQFGAEQVCDAMHSIKCIRSDCEARVTERVGVQRWPER